MTEELEDLLLLTRTMGERDPCRYLRLVMVSRRGEVRMLEVSGDATYRMEVYQALCAGLVALGVLGFEEFDGYLRGKRILFPWHNGERRLSTLFEQLCDEAVDGMQQEFEKRRRVN